MNFSPSLESEQYGDSEHTLQTMESVLGGVLFSLPSFLCLSSHLPDPTTLNLPSRVGETERKVR